MPALYALAQHDAIESINAQLLPGEVVMAYLDDIYAVCSPDRAVDIFAIVRRELADRAGVSLNLAKCCVWNRAGARPAGIEGLSGVKWCGDAQLPEAERGLKVLGSPLGTEAYVQEFAAARLRDGRAFLEKLRLIPDLQASWILLLLCAAPRANHLLRTLPPSLPLNTPCDTTRRCGTH